MVPLMIMQVSGHQGHGKAVRLDTMRLTEAFPQAQMPLGASQIRGMMKVLQKECLIRDAYLILAFFSLQGM